MMNPNKALFYTVDELLSEEFDRYMELLRPTETEFYNSYFAARVVKETGVRHKPVDPEETKTPPAAPQQA
jgi:hypothetical protein